MCSLSHCLRRALYFAGGAGFLPSTASRSSFVSLHPGCNHLLSHYMMLAIKKSRPDATLHSCRHGQISPTSVIICYLPLIEGTRKLHWIVGLGHSSTVVGTLLPSWNCNNFYFPDSHNFVATSRELKIFLPPNLFHSCHGVGQVKVQDPTPNGTTKSSPGPPVPRPLWPNWEHFPSTVHQSAALPWACNTVSWCFSTNHQVEPLNHLVGRKDRNETLAPKRDGRCWRTFSAFFRLYVSLF